MFYLVKTPKLVEKLIYPGYTWSLSDKEKKIYLTFDDGPHPEVTPFVLDALKDYNAKATFFCIGKNVTQHPDVYKRILGEGHRVGNHTQDHLNGSHVDDKTYLKNIIEAANYIDSNLFRPPYGRISSFQAQQVKEKLNFEIIMWSVLSGDFDIKVKPEVCLNNVIKATGQGSIVVFHDSEKAHGRVRYTLPRMLKHFDAAGYAFERLPGKGRMLKKEKE